MEARPRIPKPFVRVLVAVALFTVPSLAAAPPDQYQYFDRDSVTILDDKTKLEWSRVPSNSLSRIVADTFCSPGRVPTIKELSTILDEEPHPEYEFGNVVTKMIDPQAFPDRYTPIDLVYWSSTPAGPGKVWTLDFKDGTMQAVNIDGSGRVRCVK